MLGLGGCWSKYRRGNISLGFMGLINLVMIITWPKWNFFIENSDTVRICMRNFKRRTYNFKTFEIIIIMQQIKNNSSSIFMKGQEESYKKK